jgi:protein-tyrosine phosphatase
MAPFTVLHVCVGNICRSPMAERLLVLALRELVGDDLDDRYLSHGAGTGSWHVGEEMNPPAARQVIARGGDPGGFAARRVSGDLVDMSDLVLCATGEQVAYVLDLRPDADHRTFTLREFGRLLGTVDLDRLPAVGDCALTAYDRGLALVAEVDRARHDRGVRLAAGRGDDLADPWGMPDVEFSRVADQIQETVIPLAAALAGAKAVV